MREPRPLRPLWPPLIKRDTRGKARDRQAAAARQQSRIPLTHHDILVLAEPFTRRGRHVDLAASDRLERCLLFKPTEHSGTPDEFSTLIERLLLENPGRSHFRLTRTLTDESGRVATLRVDGPDPKTLIEAIDAVPPERQFPTLGGLRVACSYRIEASRIEPTRIGPGGQIAAEEGASHPPVNQLTLVRAVTDLDGMAIILDPRVGYGMPAEISLEVPRERAIALPADLLTVLGEAWRPLRRVENGWRGHLRIPGQEPARTADVEAKLAKTLVHLVETLRAPPAEFDRKWRRERWQAVAHRILGLLTVVVLLVAAPAILLANTAEGSPLRVLSFALPALVMLILLSRHEAPMTKMPPLPRPLPDTAWDPAPPTQSPGPDRRV
jgi:hypothetical protein